jgi:hypothetical protein
LTNYSGAGGGGAGSAGANANANNGPRSGGSGVSSSISGSAVTYASGGTGGARSGSDYTPGNGTNGRGDGGDGAPCVAATDKDGARGGSGIVIISYVSALYPAPTYVPGVYGQAINFNNTLSAAGADPNCYATYDVSSFNLSSNSATMSLWLNSGLAYPGTAGTTPFYVNLQGASYNGLYTSGASSNITFRIGSRPINVGTQVTQTGVWSHHCAVFSNVGADTSNTTTTYYVNGSLVGSANNTVQSFTTLNLGCQNSGSDGALCSIDDVRLFKTALSADQVQTIYAAQGMPNQLSFSGTGTTYMNGTGTIRFT